MNVKEIREKIEETSKWTPGSTKDIGMRALGQMLLNRMGQVEFDEGIFVEQSGLVYPSLFDRMFHVIGFHSWLEFDDTNVFDGTKRICLICGRTESSMMNRANAYYELSAYHELSQKKLYGFIKSAKYTEKR